MQIREIMNTNVIKVYPSTPLIKLINLFKNFHTFPMVPVVDQDNILRGKVSFENLLDVFRPYAAATRSLLKAIPFLDQEDPLDLFKVEITSEMGLLLVVDDFMDKNVLSINENTDLEEAYKIMKIQNRDHLPVIDRNSKLIGIIGVFDIVLSLFRDQGVIQ